MKKNANAQSFHWLFVIIAGGAIFLLFTFFIQAGQNHNETSISVDVMLHFDTIFSTLVTPNKIDIGDLRSSKDITLEFSCDVYGGTVQSWLNVNDASRKINDIILYSQEKVTGDRIMVVADNFALPYSVSSLIYVTDPRTAYILVPRTQNHAKQLRSILPQNATILQVGGTDYDYATLNSIDFTAYKDVVIIESKIGSGQFSVTAYPWKASAFNKDSIYVYTIETTEELLEGGTITAYKPQKEGSQYKFNEVEGEFEYADKELLAGAIVSENFAHFECVTDKLYHKIKRSTAILQKRAELLAIEYDLRQNLVCKKIYDDAVTTFEATIVDPGNYAFQSEILQSYNQRLLMLSCPLLY